MHLVVGLGNPGARYRDTRHNVGFTLVDRLAARWRIVLRSAAGELAEYGEGMIGAIPVVLAKPTTLMNASGAAVAALRSTYAPADIILVSDDLDLPLGRVRIRGGGSSGGHRGVASVLEAVGTELVRVRLGIGRPPEGLDAVEFVLQPFTPAERAPLDDALAYAALGVETLLRDGLEAAMRLCNGMPVSGGAAE